MVWGVSGGAIYSGGTSAVKLSARSPATRPTTVAGSTRLVPSSLSRAAPCPGTAPSSTRSTRQLAAASTPWPSSRSPIRRISGNTAVGQGGGFSVGGVFASSANALITNTTVAGNTVTAGTGRGWRDLDRHGRNRRPSTATRFGGTRRDRETTSARAFRRTVDGTLLQMGDTIVAANTHGPNCFRSPVTGVNDFGFNLDDGGSCPLTQPHRPPEHALRSRSDGLAGSRGLHGDDGAPRGPAPRSMPSPRLRCARPPISAEHRELLLCDIGAYMDTDTTGPFSVVPVTGSQTYGGTPTFSWFDITPAGVTLSGSASCSTSGLGAGNDMLDPIDLFRPDVVRPRRPRLLRGRAQRLRREPRHLDHGSLDRRCQPALRERTIDDLHGDGRHRQRRTHRAW